MRTFMHGIVMIAIGIFVVLSIYTVMVSINMKKQLTNAMSTAVDAAVEQAMEGCGYTLSDIEEFKYEFMQDLCIQSGGDGEMKVEFNHVDYDEGLMAVTVTKEFKYPVKTTGHITYSKLVIFEEEVVDDNLYTVTFMSEDGELVRAYKVYSGNDVVTPEGEWIDVDTGEEISGQIKVFYDLEYIKKGA